MRFATLLPVVLAIVMVSWVKLNPLPDTRAVLRHIRDHPGELLSWPHEAPLLPWPQHDQ